MDPSTIILDLGSNESFLLSADRSSGANLMYQKLNKAISFIHQTSPKSNFNTYVGKNNLFNNMSLEDNFFHQSLISDWEQFLGIFSTKATQEEAKVSIYDFRKFLIADLPFSAVPLISFVDSILKDTEYLIYQSPTIIYEEEMNIISNVMVWASTNHQKNFIDIEKKLTISPSLSSVNIIKKAA